MSPNKLNLHVEWMYPIEFNSSLQLKYTAFELIRLFLWLQEA